LPIASTASGMWSLLDRCINTCLNAHTFCQQDYEENFIPTRLIDIGSDSCPRIKVINTVDTPQSSRKFMRYIALSHRWGTSKFFTLNESNIHQCSQEIDLDALPQTFKDTVDVSRLLGYRYGGSTLSALFKTPLLTGKENLQRWVRCTAILFSI
jgi:hypothetical protein